MKATTTLAVVVVVVGCAAAAHADLDLSYMGAFRALAGAPQVYGGGLAFYPGGGGAGSLFLSDAPVSAGKEVFELDIPSLVITSDVANLNLATTLGSFDASTDTHGLVWRSTEDLLYLSKSATGSQSVRYRYVNRDGTGESTERAGPAWRQGGFGLTQVPDDWAAAYCGGNNLVTVAPLYGPRLSAVDPWNDPVSQIPLLEYNNTNTVEGYDYSDAYNAVEWVSFAGQDNFIVAGKNTSGLVAKLWFYRAEDIANATTLYEPQPYQTLIIEDVLFGGEHTLWGLTYDADNAVLYGYEGGWNQTTVVHAWQVAPEPMSVALLALGGLVALRRRWQTERVGPGDGLNVEKEVGTMSKILLSIVAAGLLVSPAIADTVVIKEGSDIVLNDDLDPAFAGVLTTDIVNGMADTAFHDNLAANVGYPDLDLFLSGHDDKLMIFDLASLPGFVGGTVHVAQLRIRQTAGNAGGSTAPIFTHAWDPTLATRFSPVGGATPEWGPLSDSVFSAADAAAPTNMVWSGFEVGPAGNYEGWLTGDVTADVQAIADGTANYGWHVYTSNRSIIASEHERDAYRPALFVSYTPEPAALGLLAVGGLLTIARRRRK
jgi:hypothetical protein